MDAGPRLLTGRCTVVVAAAGYGKTEAVRRWLGRTPARWTIGTCPAEVGPGLLVIDDASRVGGPDLRRLLAQLADQPSARAVLISRSPLSLPAATRTGVVIDECHGADLALTEAATVELLGRDYGLRETEFAVEVHRLTCGWPALVRLAGQHLAQAGDATPAGLAGALGADGTPVATYLNDNVLAPLPAAAARLVRDVAHLGAIDEDMCRALGHRHPGRTIGRLAVTGLVGARAPLSLVPLVGEVARRRWPLSDDDRECLFSVAGAWYAARGQWRDAIEAFLRSGRTAECAGLLRAHGPSWVNAGGAATIASAVASLPPVERDDDIEQIYCDALLALGEAERALSVLAPSTSTDGELSAGLSWRLGAVHYQRGDLASASRALDRGLISQRATRDEAMVLAGRANGRWMAGDAQACGDLAGQALAAAERADDDGARSAAHIALALHAMLRGDRVGNASHYEQALRCAQAAGDLVQAARIHTNHAARLLEEARYQDALERARQAQATAEKAGASAVLAVAACNEAEALFRLGRLDEAAACSTRALARFQSSGSRKAAYALVNLGAIHRACGRDSLARAAYEEAAAVATAAGDMQGAVAALAGLARVLSRVDPAAAVQTAAEAVQSASGPYEAEALLAAGWAALAAGDEAAARDSAERAAARARPHRDLRSLADALELRAATTSDPAERRRALCEAADTWRMSGAALDRDRLAVAVGSLPDATVSERTEARLARERLVLAGVPALPAAALDAGRDHDVGHPIYIRTLGRFDVWVGDTVVSMSMWQSRKARDLLRILVARRGRAIARDELAELLWPGGDPDRLAHRLSVALSTVRNVLDPERSADSDRYLRADHSGVALAMDRVVVDLEVFLDEVAHGLGLLDRGLHAEARAALVLAESRYAGEFMEDDPYEDWSVPAREEARAAYLRTLRALAVLCADRTDDAVHYLLKLLGTDPYDERGHRELVDTLAVAGRYGESRRAQARYAAAMREIGVDVSL